MARPKVKPQNIYVGHAYRMRPIFGRGPGKDVVIVTRIEPMSKTSNKVWFVVLSGPDEEQWDNLSSFRVAVYAEETRALQ